MVTAAQKKAEAKRLEVFAKAAAKEQALREKVKAKEISMASAAAVKIKKALQPLKTTVANPNIIHVPAVTLDPLASVIRDYEQRLATLEKVEAGTMQWDPKMAVFTAKEGKAAEKPVIAILSAMAKYKQ